MAQDFIIVKQAAYVTDIYPFVAKLESEGIPCIIGDEHTLNVHPLAAVAIGGVKLKVRASDAERALEIIKEVEGVGREVELNLVPVNIINRGMARLIDLIPILILYLFINAIAGEDNKWLAPMSILIYILTYLPISDSRGGTFGKRFLKIRISSLKTDTSPSLSESYIRAASIAGIYIILWGVIWTGVNYDLIFITLLGIALLVIIPHFTVPSSPHGQTIYDYISGIVVFETEKKMIDTDEEIPEEYYQLDRFDEEA